MSIAQTILLAASVTVPGGAISYFLMQPKTKTQSEVDCVKGMAALPLKNNAAAMGMSVAIQQCDYDLPP